MALLLGTNVEVINTTQGKEDMKKQKEKNGVNGRTKQRKEIEGTLLQSV